MTHDTLFSTKDFQTQAVAAILQKVKDLDAKKALIQKWQATYEAGKLAQLTETQLDVEFLKDIFCSVLGYTSAIGSDTNDWELTVKGKTDIDGTIPDATLGYFGVGKANEVRIIIELKGARINLDKPQNRKDFKGSPIEQGFAYFPKYSERCNWLIVSNFEEIRLYHRNMGIRKYESFLLVDLLEEQNLKKFFFLLNNSQLYLLHEKSPVDILFEERRAKEKTISEEFYYQYAAFREELFYGLRKNNSAYSNAELIRCTQKVIDRILFMCFVRDTLQIGDILGRTMLAVNELFYEQEDKLWQSIQRTFTSFNKGFSVRKGSLSIPPFNGGLFSPDKTLEKLHILDIYIEPIIEFFLKYDFQSELNVNILGHIFEQSITDLENFKREIELETENSLTGEGESIENRVDKRKKDGVFYTPEYITEYIINESLGAYLEEERNALLAKFETENLAYWHDYQRILKDVKIVDPACGSGAFLTKVVDFLYTEWQIVRKEIARFQPEKKEKKRVKMGLFENEQEYATQEWEIKKQIVSNNIYGVDLNIESVEITKLSLWLKTANRKIALSDLSKNIRQGNSLIEDISVTPVAFDWQKAFPEVMKKGGFEVVMGNPPFVRADIEDAQYQKERQWIAKNFEFLFEKWDLMTAFYEKGLKLVRNNGYFSFISSNAILTSKYGEKLLEWIAKSFEVKTIDYFEKMEVFPGVGVIPTIITIQKKAPTQFLVQKRFRVGTFKNVRTEKIDTKDFAERVSLIFRKVYESIDVEDNTTPLAEICYISVGMVINADEKKAKNAFSKNDILSRVKTKIHKYQIVEGKDLKRYKIQRVKYIEWDTERVPNLLRRTTFPALYMGEKILRGRVTGGVFDDTGIMCNDGVIVFKRWKDLAQVQERSISNSVAKNHFAEQGSKTAEEVAKMRKDLEDISEKFHLKYLLAIINSKFAYWYLNNFRRHRLEDYFYPDDFRSLPIPNVPTEQKEYLINRVTLLQKYYQDAPQISAKFWELMCANFKQLSLEAALKVGLEGNWAEVVDFLQKQKVELSAKQQFEWQELFVEQKANYQSVTELISQTENEIDVFVCDLYKVQELEKARILDNGE